MKRFGSQRGRSVLQAIGGGTSGGFDTVKLQVQFYRKFPVPLLALIMVMIAEPFAFLRMRS